MAKQAPKTTKPKTTTPKVFIARTGDVREVNFTEGMTIGAAIKAAGYVRDRGTEVRVNNTKVTKMNTLLKAGDQITLLGEIAGA